MWVITVEIQKQKKICPQNTISYGGQRKCSKCPCGTVASNKLIFELKFIYNIVVNDIFIFFVMFFIKI
jgi:hypothetical protein